MALAQDSSPSDTATLRSRWSRVLEAGGDPDALRELAASYWYCAYAWWRRAGLDAERAVTGTLASIHHWLTEAPPQRADPDAARLREWLPAQLAALAACGLKLPETPAIEIDPAWAEARYAQEPAGEADAIFQRRWALTVLEFTHDALRSEYAARGRDEQFERLLPFAGIESDEAGYQSLAATSGLTLGAARKAVFEFRARYRELLRAFLADTLADPALLDSELTALLCVCGPPESAESTDATPVPTPTNFQHVKPEFLLARALQSVRMTTDGGTWQPPTLEEAARLFPSYTILGLLGRGGMGAVYQAKQPTLDRLVAIKLLPLEVSVDHGFAERFIREARTMARLDHPNLITVHEFGQTSEGHLFFVMEFVDGANLWQLIHGKAPGAPASLEPARALEIFAAICDALVYAHGEGVVHRDIKPSNIMVDRRGRVKVADFGLARLDAPDTEDWGQTRTGAVMGTLHYMAPEQMWGMKADQRADIYALGVMLYEMLCGRVPKGVFDPPSQRCGCDPRLDAVILKAMQQEPERRYQTAQEMKADVEAVRTPVAGSPASVENPAPPPGPSIVQPPGRKSGAGKRRALLFAGAAIVLLAAAIGGAINRRKAPPGGSAPPAANKQVSPAAAAGEVHSFGEHLYQFVPGDLTWNEAKAKAEGLGGHLAVVTSKEESEWIYATFGGNLNSGLRASSIWLGGTAEASGQPWKWVTGEPFVFTDWNRGEPDYTTTTGLPVKGPFGISLKSRQRLHWFDDPVDRKNSNVGFIVEWDRAGVAPSPSLPASSPTKPVAPGASAPAAPPSAER